MAPAALHAQAGLQTPLTDDLVVCVTLHQFVSKHVGEEDDTVFVMFVCLGASQAIPCKGCN